MNQLDLGAARPTRFTVSTGTIAALQCGNAGAPDVLLVPGYTGSKEDFTPIMTGLAEAGLRATAIDLPGQFESDGPDDVAAYSPRALGNVVLELCAELGTQLGTEVRAGLSAPVHLLGHSFGGLVVRAAVIAKPDAVHDLVLLDSGPAALGGLRKGRIEQLRPVLPVLGLAGVWQAMQVALSMEAGYVAPPPELHAFLEKRFLAGNPAMLEGMGEALVAEPDRVEALRATGIRCLVITGADDDAWAPDVQATMAQRLGAKQIVIDKAAHSPAVENPDATLDALLGFWT